MKKIRAEKIANKEKAEYLQRRACTT